MTKIALLIGVSEYEKELDPLPSAAKDIEAMREVLVVTSQKVLEGHQDVKP
jgi:uncharacterized caspase-like protein